MEISLISSRPEAALVSGRRLFLELGDDVSGGGEAAVSAKN